jgi:hypothetical protein
MSTRDAPGPPEPLILAAPRRAAVIAAVIAVLTAVVFGVAACSRMASQPAHWSASGRWCARGRLPS